MKSTSPKPESLTVGDLLTPKPKNRYLIPRYQRNYSWGEAEISQLIRDVEDCRKQREDSPYYIGTLVVHRRPEAEGGEYETIDGQQRLTTLSILMAYLRRRNVKGTEEFNGPVIRFQSRAASERIINELFVSVDPEQYCDRGNSLTKGFTEVGNALKIIVGEDAGPLERFTRYLCDRVTIFRVQVPPDTDLNHYFEVMNSRGEQLEKHEVIKARLMSSLDRDEGRTFGKIWEACANMEKYLQMSFSKAERESLFGDDWDNLPPKRFSEVHRRLVEISSKEIGAGAGRGARTLAGILDEPLQKASGSGDEEMLPDQFHPVINFPNFLLHVLGVHTRNADAELDDKKLLVAFSKSYPDKGDPDAVKAFACDLLRARFLFDQFVIKRDYRSGNDAWSLMRMKKSSESNSYVNTFGERAADVDNKRLLMLQAALHVSNPSMSYKYWLLGALRFLMDRQISSPGSEATEFLAYLESMARGFVFDVYLEADGTRQLANVTATADQWSVPSRQVDGSSELLRYRGIRNNLVFNFLDYLLWIGGRKRQFPVSGFNAEEFKFTFRSSVEHHAPQHPENGVNEFGDDVHAFGNLYLISHSKNSRLSNFRAETKKGEFLRSRTADSLKQQFMIEYSGDWNIDAMRRHQDSMIRVLEAATQGNLPFDPRAFSIEAKTKGEVA